MASKNNLTSVPGTSWADLYGISAAKQAGLEAEVKNGNGCTYVEGRWTGAGAITLSNYNNFPIGSIILDFQAFKTHYKTGATTWKSSAAAS
jgi:hypothetical protein